MCAVNPFRGRISSSVCIRHEDHGLVNSRRRYIPSPFYKSPDQRSGLSIEAFYLPDVCDPDGRLRAIAVNAPGGTPELGCCIGLCQSMATVPSIIFSLQSSLLFPHLKKVRFSFFVTLATQYGFRFTEPFRRSATSLSCSSRVRTFILSPCFLDTLPLFYRRHPPESTFPASFHFSLNKVH